MKLSVLSEAQRTLVLYGSLGAALLVSACGGGADATGPAGQSIALRTVAEQAGANCATGGTKIEAGPDGNANGLLDDREVNSTAYVCNGQSGLAGVAGVAGVPGVGTVGATGPVGPSGATGAAGPAGAAGTAGAPGATGPAGPAGTPGTAGAPGATGLTGPAGASTVIQSCDVPASAIAVVDACGDKTTGISVLIQAGADNGKGVADDPTGITSVVMLCGAGSTIGSAFNPRYLAPPNLRMTCATIK